MRAIDADALIDIFEDRLEKIRNRYGDYSGETGVCAGALHLIRVQPTIEPEPCEDAEFWRKRAEYYSKMCLDLIADMNQGVKIDSIEINEEGIKFKKTQPEPQWIPCSEKLPEKNGRYIVTRGLKACNSIWNRVYIVNYSDLMGLKAEKIWWDGNVGKSDFQRVDDVIAWMPLPEPYREEGEE